MVHDYYFYCYSSPGDVLVVEDQHEMDLSGQEQ